MTGRVTSVSHDWSIQLVLMGGADISVCPTPGMDTMSAQTEMSVPPLFSKQTKYVRDDEDMSCDKDPAPPTVRQWRRPTRNCHRFRRLQALKSGPNGRSIGDTLTLPTHVSVGPPPSRGETQRPTADSQQPQANCHQPSQEPRHVQRQSMPSNPFSPRPAAFRRRPSLPLRRNITPGAVRADVAAGQGRPGRLLGRTGQERSSTGSRRSTRRWTATCPRRSGSSAARSTPRYNCLDRHLTTWRKNKAAIIWEGEPGDVRDADLSAAASRGLQVRQRARKAGRQAGRPRHALHADDPRTGDRHAGLCPHRGDALDHLRRLQRRRHRRPQQRRRSPNWSSRPTPAGDAARRSRSRTTSTTSLEKIAHRSRRSSSSAGRAATSP